MDRRDFLKGAVVGGAALLAPPVVWRSVAQAAPADFRNRLAIPPALDLRNASTATLGMSNAVHDFGGDLPAVRTFRYTGASGTQSAAPTYLGPTIVAKRDTALEVTVSNGLGAHPLAAFVDTGLSDVTETDRTAPRASVHLHGGNTEPGSDGSPEDTFTPGQQHVYTYDNDQEAAGLWYHDHAMGITRLNVYAGLAGGYLLRDGNDPGDGSNGLPFGAYEVPLILQDRLFKAGQLNYPLGAGRVWAPEMFGNVPTVNGTAWANLPVDLTRYRFRVYNGSNARVYRMGLKVLATGAPLTFHQIGTDGGLLDAPVPLTSLVLGPGERADLLVDFSSLRPGARVVLTNNAPTPYPNGGLNRRRGGVPLPEVMVFTTTNKRPTTPPMPTSLRAKPVPDLSPYEPERIRTMTLVEIMGDLQPTTALLNNRAFDDEGYKADDQLVEQDTLEVWELVNTTGDAHPIHLHLVQFQVLNRQPFDVPGYLTDVYGTTMLEENTGPYPPPHPVDAKYLTGSAAPPPANEAGWKDTVLAMPGEVTRIVVPFGQPAELLADGIQVASPKVWSTANDTDYVWHCHILEHEDNDMMQRYAIR